jgi:hypothetical protein
MIMSGAEFSRSPNFDGHLSRAIKDVLMPGKIKSLIKRALAPMLLGILDYYRFPEVRDSWGGPLNGQQRRQEIVAALLNRLGIDTVVETGTFRGTSTEYFASLCGGRVFTIEADDRLYGYSKMRLLFRRGVTIFHGDSRSVLRSLATDRQLSGKRVLFYLDAHWGEDLPLADELDLVFRQWPKAVVMIDDFQVPDDPGYKYDDYGPGKALTLGYIQPLIEQYGLSVFFPAASSTEETGAKRGCVLLVADPYSIQEMHYLAAALRPYVWANPGENQ